MYPIVAQERAVALVEEVKKFVDGESEFAVVERSHRALLRCCGGKLGDDSRLAFRDLKQAVDECKDVSQSAKVFIQALAHEFESLHGELTKQAAKPADPQPKTQPKKSEKPDSK
ncbi:hypothetical protein [Gimesia fumaroli]|uniref:Uncharacterized protein n=1 Tax=Gimesia fumaroli TaxID=2527976 RepID=A0A518I957_9PLAN|nr:hypothetical protein [Gimesia fumaroli]QDV49532.1 hypothetical protein Enr17x_15510 [Gimesia fumaroli]